MNLKKHSFFKGDSYDLSVVSDKYIDLDAYTVEFYMHYIISELTTSPIITKIVGDGLTKTNHDEGAIVSIAFSPSDTSLLDKELYYYTIKLTENLTKKETLENGLIVFETFMGEYYLGRFRKFLKDEDTVNKGEFLDTVENEDTDLRDYLSRAVDDFNNSYYKTEYTIDTFPDESLLFIGGLLQALTSNGIMSARCALSYQDATGVMIRDLDRWGRYQNLFNQYFGQYKQKTMEFKRSWNLENSFESVPGVPLLSDVRHRGRFITSTGDHPDEAWG